MLQPLISQGTFPSNIKDAAIIAVCDSIISVKRDGGMFREVAKFTESVEEAARNSWDLLQKYIVAGSCIYNIE